MNNTLATAARTDKLLLRESDPGKIALQIRDLRRVFLPRNGKAVEALSGVSLTVSQAEVVAVLGPSGCGKSSMLRILAGLDTDFTGDIAWKPLIIIIVAMVNHAVALVARRQDPGPQSRRGQ